MVKITEKRRVGIGGKKKGRGGCEKLSGGRIIKKKEKRIEEQEDNEKKDEEGGKYKEEADGRQSETGVCLDMDPKFCGIHLSFVFTNCQVFMSHRMFQVIQIPALFTQRKLSID